jgi:hypothetical protein
MNGWIGLLTVHDGKDRTAAGFFGKNFVKPIAIPAAV